MSQRTTEEIKEILGTSWKVALYALRIIAGNDMWDALKGRQDDTVTMGFICKDRQILSSFAYHFIQNGCLSPKQEVVLLKRMPKYAKQYMEFIYESDDEEDAEEEEDSTENTSQWGLDFLE